MNPAVLVLFFFIGSIVCASVDVQRNEELRETAHVIQLPSIKDRVHLVDIDISVTKKLHGISADKEYEKFPLFFYRLLESSGAHLMEMTSAAGRWKPQWGTHNDLSSGFSLDARRPFLPVPPGITSGLAVSACLRKDETTCGRWRRMLRLLGSTFSNAASQFFSRGCDPNADEVPHYIKLPAVSIDLHNESCYFGTSSIEPFCTENLSPLLAIFSQALGATVDEASTSGTKDIRKLRPQGLLASLVPSYPLFFSTPYHAMRLRLERKDSNLFALLNVQYIADEGSLVSGKETRNFLDKALSSVTPHPEAVLSAMHTGVPGHMGLFDLKFHSEKSYSDAIAAEPIHDPLLESSPVLEIHSHVIQHGEIDGELHFSIGLNNSLSRASLDFVGVMLMIPHHVIIPFVSTLHYECPPSCPRCGLRVRTVRFEKASNAIVVLLRAKVCPKSSEKLNALIKFTYPNMRLSDYPPDANKPYVIPPLLASYCTDGIPLLSLPHSQVLSRAFFATELNATSKKCYFAASQERMSVSSPIPDNAMQFNGLILASTIFGLVFGNIFSIVVRDNIGPIK